MTPDTPNPASAAALTGSGNNVCFGGEQFPDSAPAQKYQAQNFPAHPAPRKRLSWFEARTAGHMAMTSGQRKDSNNDTIYTANRELWQDVLDRPRPASGLVLPRPIRGRIRGTCLCADELPRRLEGIAPLGPGNGTASCFRSPKNSAPQGLKFWRGPFARPPQRRARGR